MGGGATSQRMYERPVISISYALCKYVYGKVFIVRFIIPSKKYIHVEKHVVWLQSCEGSLIRVRILLHLHFFWQFIRHKESLKIT